MPTVNYLLESFAENVTKQIEMRAIGKITKSQNEAYKGLPIYQLIKTNLQR